MQGTISCYKNNPDRRKIRIIGTDMNPMAYNFVGVDKFYQVSRCTDPRYISELYDICRKEHVDVLIPCNTNELELLSLQSYKFEKINTKVLVSDITGLRIANDKIHSYEYFKTVEIKTPTTLITSSYDELKAFLEDNEGTTFVMKQRHGCGSRGFRIIGSNDNLLADKPSGVFIEDEELKRVFNGEAEYLVQEYLPGDEYTVDVVACHGDVVQSACKLNSNMEKGVARKSVIVRNDKCLEQCIKVCERLNLHGNIGFDLKCDKEGFPVIIDVNPRLTATVSLIAMAGMNMPYNALCLELGESVRTGDLKYGTSLVRRIKDYYFDEGGMLIDRRSFFGNIRSELQKK